MKEQVTFSTFAYLHYKKGMYVASIGDIEKIFERAKAYNSEFVVHLGDMCNDYIRSLELVDAYLNNKQGFEVYGIYGNHELETLGNTMPIVTPLLTNRMNDVVWGTEDGKIGDGRVAYYYFDKGSFRFICLDANYSLNPSTGKYEHNHNASWGAPAENKYPCSLGEEQMIWLKKVLFSAAKEEKHCIVLSHPSFSGLWQPCNDAQKIRILFKKANEARRNTVILALNGHLHTNRQAVIEDVVYLDINAVRSGWWEPKPFDPYKEEDINAPRYTFEFTDYEQGGRSSQSFQRPLSSLTMGAQTLFFKDPLSATLTVCEDGFVSMKGCATEWMYGIAPNREYDKSLLKISDFEKR